MTARKARPVCLRCGRTLPDYTGGYCLPCMAYRQKEREKKDNTRREQTP